MPEWWWSTIGLGHVASEHAYTAPNSVTLPSLVPRYQGGSCEKGPLLAQSGHASSSTECRQSGVKRT